MLQEVGLALSFNCFYSGVLPKVTWPSWFHSLPLQDICHQWFMTNKYTEFIILHLQTNHSCIVHSLLHFSVLYWTFVYFHFTLASDPPFINPVDFGETDLYEGGIGSATCIVSQGSLPLMVTWTYNGKILRSDKYRKIHSFGKRASILTIEPLSHLHQGVYGCEAFNAAGAYKVETELVIQGKMNKWFKAIRSMISVTWSWHVVFLEPRTWVNWSTSNKCNGDTYDYNVKFTILIHEGQHASLLEKKNLVMNITLINRT